MEQLNEMYQTYVEILKEELTPAFGCTEPIAIAYCAAKARETLGVLPEEVQIEVSNNIIKNVKSVIVPNTGGLKGIPAAASAGIVAGKTEKVLEVIAEVAEEQKPEIKSYLERTLFSVSAMTDCDRLDIRITVRGGGQAACVRISHNHANIISIEKNGETVWQKNNEVIKPVGEAADRDCLSVEMIYQFAKEVPLASVRELLKCQADYNYRIAEVGISGNWGANVGKVILKTEGTDVRTRAKAMAAAGSDARMSGCELPVVINAGSGNQGITVSVPVIEYARETGAEEEQLYRALLVSNLISVHIKHGIGPLSAFCGAVSAGCAAGCGIAFLLGGSLRDISHTLVNAIAIVSGIVCDGAKPSCAGKIASSVDAGILGYHMIKEGQQFYAEDGIVSNGVESTIKNICRLGAKGMCGTDEEIIRIMTHCD